MRNHRFLIILTTILNCLNLIQSDELLELKCLNEMHCKLQFQHSGIKSSCIEEQCQCTTSNGESVKCQPLNHKVNNIIGGPCPCQQPNAECGEQENVCYCASDYMPSSDKRRCILKIVALFEKCELDSQCQNADFSAICSESKQCICMDYFVYNEGKCISTVGNKTFCSNDDMCHQHYGDNSKCSNITQHCICAAGHIASVDNSRCLKISKYLEVCVENIQCMGSMGPGAKCTDNICQCSEKYFDENKKIDGDVMETVCTPVVERGHYCRIDEDCYQRQLNETEQSMYCIYGECNCKKGFYSYNEGDCVKGSGAGIKSLMGLNFMMVVCVLLNKYF